MSVPERFKYLVIPPYTDEDSIDDPKFRQIIDVRLNTALHNANVNTVADLREAVRTGRLDRMRNVGTIGRIRVGVLLGIGREENRFSALAEALRDQSYAFRLAWFRDLGAALRATGFDHHIVDELEAYNE